MRKKKSWVMWCIVVALALLALAVPALQAQGRAPAGKPVTEPGTCRVLDETGYWPVYMPADITYYYDKGGLAKVVCKGAITIQNADLVPVRYDSKDFTIYCDAAGSFDWTQSISKQGKVTLTCYAP